MGLLRIIFFVVLVAAGGCATSPQPSPYDKEAARVLSQMKEAEACLPRDTIRFHSAPSPSAPVVAPLPAKSGSNLGQLLVSLLLSVWLAYSVCWLLSLLFIKRALKWLRRNR